MKLKTLKPRLMTLSTSRLAPAPVMEHGARPAGRGWQGTRARIQLRDESLCRRCGLLWVSSRDAVDHITPRWAGGSDEDGNLWLLCKGCHDAKSDEEAAMRAAGGYVMPEWVASLLRHAPAPVV